MEIEIATTLVQVVLASFALYIHQQKIMTFYYGVCIVILQLASVALFVLGLFQQLTGLLREVNSGKSHCI
jgi:uncharacterized membrane protein